MSRKRSDFSSYNNMPRESMRRDIVRFLLWARDRTPGVFVSYSEVCQRINGYARAPGPNTREVQMIRSAGSAVRKILMTEHHCTLLTDPVGGMRATVDKHGGVDVLQGQMVKAGGRLQSAQKMFTLTAGLIDISQVPNTAENQPLITYYKGGVVPVARAIEVTNFSAKLLPPSTNGTHKK